MKKKKTRYFFHSTFFVESKKIKESIHDQFHEDEDDVVGPSSCWRTEEEDEEEVEDVVEDRPVRPSIG